MTTMIVSAPPAPKIRNRKALVFLDREGGGSAKAGGAPDRRLVHALISEGYAVQTAECDAGDQTRAGAFLDAVEPGDLLLVRWSTESGWGPGEFGALMGEFARRVERSDGAALVLIVDFGWLVTANPGQSHETLSRLHVRGEPVAAAAALTTSATMPADRPGRTVSLTAIMADGILSGEADLDGDGTISVGDLYRYADERCADLGADRRPYLLTYGEGELIAVAYARRSARDLGPAFGAALARLASAGDTVAPASARELVGRIYDVHLDEDARELLRRATLLADDEPLTTGTAALLMDGAPAEGAPGHENRAQGGPGQGGRVEGALRELAAWGLLGEGTPFADPAVRHALTGRADVRELAQVSTALRRWRAARRAVQPRARLTGDRWTLQDRLGHRVRAEAVAAFIRHAETRPPLTIGVKGPWGAGKTSLMRMVQDLLDPGAAEDRPAEIRLTATARDTVLPTPGRRGAGSRGGSWGAGSQGGSRGGGSPGGEAGRSGSADAAANGARSQGGASGGGRAWGGAAKGGARSQGGGRAWGGAARGGRARVTNAEVLSRAKEAESGGSEYAIPGELPLRHADWRPTVWFNPWMYQSGEQVWAGLAHEIISQVTGRLPRGERERFWLALNLARVDREEVRRRAYRLAATRLLPVALALCATLLVTGASLAAAALVPAAGSLLRGAAAAVGSGGSLLVLVAAGVRLARFMGESADSAFTRLVRQPDLLGAVADRTKDLAPDPGYRSRTGFLHLVQTDMRRVLGMVATEERPLVVFVDDLDRCSPGTVAQVIEAVNLFLAGEFPNCVFVLAMEPEVVAAHVEVAYRDLARSLPASAEERSGLGWRFLEKIVQLPLSVPMLDDAERLPAYLRALLEVPAPPDEAAPGRSAVTPSAPDPGAHPGTSCAPVAGAISGTSCPPAAGAHPGTPCDPAPGAVPGILYAPAAGAPPGAPYGAAGDTPHDRALDGRYGRASATPGVRLGARRDIAGEVVDPGGRHTGGVPAARPVPELVDSIEAAIRAMGPTAGDLDVVARRAQDTLDAAAGDVIGGLSAATRLAADRVYDDLYSDENAYAAIAQVLPALTLSNPRELKRYVNVFRFYSFVTYRRTLAGAQKVTDEAVAKLAVLTIRWPHLLSLLAREPDGAAPPEPAAPPGLPDLPGPSVSAQAAGRTVLDMLERAAAGTGQDGWAHALVEAGLLRNARSGAARWDALRALLRAEPPIAHLAWELL
ncbi:KAP family P-loop NTPase fold protein [Sphaerisporangium dianthi]|uniref:P-loop NTPase fold protein n=1 Tax=Sphaerisporangium dianthi TaxID=1436120 RepID=A0ABV9CI89_9ACTN